MQAHTPLTAAVHQRATDYVKQLLGTERANPNEPNLRGVPPLLIAARSGDLRLFSLLLEAGADINASDSDGAASALHCPCPSSTPGHTVLHLAVQGDNVDMVKLILAKGCKVNAQTNEGASALHYAMDSNLEIVGECFSTDASLRLHASHNSCSEALLEAGADVNLLDLSGHSPLHNAVIEVRDLSFV